MADSMVVDAATASTATPGSTMSRTISVSYLATTAAAEYKVSAFLASSPVGNTATPSLSKSSANNAEVSISDYTATIQANSDVPALVTASLVLSFAPAKIGTYVVKVIGAGSSTNAAPINIVFTVSGTPQPTPSPTPTVSRLDASLDIESSRLSTSEPGSTMKTVVKFTYTPKNSEIYKLSANLIYTPAGNTKIPSWRSISSGNTKVSITGNEVTVTPISGTKEVEIKLELLYSPLKIGEYLSRIIATTETEPSIREDVSFKVMATEESSPIPSPTPSRSALPIPQPTLSPSPSETDASDIEYQTDGEEIPVEGTLSVSKKANGKYYLFVSTNLIGEQFELIASKKGAKSIKYSGKTGSKSSFTISTTRNLKGFTITLKYAGDPLDSEKVA
jgi:hypothetical protein